MGCKTKKKDSKIWMQQIYNSEAHTFLSNWPQAQCATRTAYFLRNRGAEHCAVHEQGSQKIRKKNRKSDLI